LPFGGDAVDAEFERRLGSIITAETFNGDASRAIKMITNLFKKEKLRFREEGHLTHLSRGTPGWRIPLFGFKANPGEESSAPALIIDW
jgi:hypothetical protein